MSSGHHASRQLDRARTLRLTECVRACNNANPERVAATGHELREERQHCHHDKDGAFEHEDVAWERESRENRGPGRGRKACVRGAMVLCRGLSCSTKTQGGKNGTRRTNNDRPVVSAVTAALAAGRDTINAHARHFEEQTRQQQAAALNLAIGNVKRAS